LGYRWQDNQYRKHHLIPLGMHLIRLISTSPEFEALLTQNSRLRQGFDNTAILGMTYRFTYNEQQLNLIKNYLYFQGTIETSGNVANWLAGSNPETEQAPFSQFLKLDSDLRYTLQGLRQSGVARLAIGVGYSYRHSQVMPYARQYFVGGANSIRAFQLRSIGPGSVAPDSDNTGSFFDQTGDIKLEANLEYRFDALPYTEGALFVDAGNIYLLRNPTNELRLQDGLFHWDQFYQQLAVGAGAGLRLDLNFVLLRFDVALPLRVPSLPANQRWVINKIALGQKNWRQSNLAYNIAIGYPF
jgi:outer membrane translocation and assembly module TamA